MGANPAVGVDISGNNGTVNWAAVAASGVEFAIIKATEGLTFRDRFFSMNWSGAKLTHIARGAYHFLRSDLGTNPKDEAEWFMSVVGLALEPGDFIALDIEDYPGRPQPADLYAWVSSWVGYVSASLDFRPLLYSTAGYLAAHNLTHKADLAECGLWLASWYDSVSGRPFPTPPPDWPVTAIWQHSATGRVPGIAGDVDLDLFQGPVERLRLYGKPAAAPAPPPAQRAITLDEATYAACATYLAEIQDLAREMGMRAELVRRALGMGDT